ncbi:DUF4369 domain-containing protein [Flavobacterium sp. NRK F10]|uniref:DUF4369 domain-containing protein n=1 Tax=Flavobacterium sediminis TaxID=2201181 RepID=A0A2U8QS46_9FLAO|nr:MULTISPECIES: DUF4369 domain-containing protein [Flavobacterium]AWM12980.1 hypothetical protein DI487_03260 [Flavobacterium sediminis]MCO6174129.1 DUF4369 domain-containing protein [Flavobacterium sp. NRK F10]
MKKVILFGLGLLAFVACNKQEQNGNVHLTGDIKGLSQGKLFIKKLQDTTLVTIDSINFKGNSNFDTAFDLESPEVIYLFLDRGQTNSIDNSLAVFAEPGNITINTSLNEFYRSAKVKGSKNHDLWKKFDSLNSKFTDANLELITKRLQNEIDFNQKTHDSIEDAYQKLLVRKYRYVANFAATHGDYEIAPYLALTEIPDIALPYLDTVAKKMTPKVAESKYGKFLKEHIEERKKSEQ